MNKTTSNAVIRVLSDMFASHVVCNTLFTDNGSQFANEDFKSFSTEWKFKYITSDHTYPQSNGLAERVMQTTKQFIKKCQEDKSTSGILYKKISDCNGDQKQLCKIVETLLGRNKQTTLPKYDSPLTMTSVMNNVFIDKNDNIRAMFPLLETNLPYY